MFDWVEDILDFLKMLGDTLISFFDFVFSLVEDLVYVIQLTGETVVKIPSYFSWLPDEAVAIIVSIFAIVVIYKVLGREG